MFDELQSPDAERPDAGSPDAESGAALATGHRGWHLLHLCHLLGRDREHRFHDVHRHSKR